MFGKIFTQIYDGTLVEHWEALVTFQQMITLCDIDGMVDMTPTALANRTGIPIEIITSGLQVLEQPDPGSRTPTEEGRRIVRLTEHRPWGWRIVNYKKYRHLATEQERRDYKREWQHKARSNGGRGQPGTDEDCTGLVRTDEDIGGQTVAKSGHEVNRQRQRKKELTTNNTPSLRSGAAVSPPSYPNWVAEAQAVYEPIGLLDFARIGKALKGAVKRYGWEQVKPWLEAYCSGKPYQRSDGSFDERPDAPKNTTWCSPEDFVSKLAFWREQTLPLPGL